MSLSLVYPVAVPLVVGGREWYVSQYRIRDLWHLERLAAGGLAGFWLDLAAAERLEGDARSDALRGLYDRAQDGLPTFGDEPIAAALESPAGRVESLWLGLTPLHPDLTRERALEIAVAMTPGDWLTADRVMWGCDPLDEVARVIDAHIGASFRAPPGKRAGWDQLIARVIRRTGYTFDQIGELYLCQWDALMRGGAKREHPTAEPKRPPKGMSWDAFDKSTMARRRAFWGGASSASTRAASSPSPPCPPTDTSPPGPPPTPTQGP